MRRRSCTGLAAVEAAVVGGVEAWFGNYHNRSAANRAPCTSASSLAHMIVGWTRRTYGPWAKPQSVPPITRSRPDQLGQPHEPLGDELGMLDDVGGVGDHAGDQHLVVGQVESSSHTRHSCSWRGLAISIA